jgi:hypothetical protein
MKVVGTLFYAYSILLFMHSKYSRSNISINLLFLFANSKERWIFWANSAHSKYCKLLYHKCRELHAVSLSGQVQTFFKNLIMSYIKNAEFYAYFKNKNLR